jgi:hypothetical protein
MLMRQTQLPEIDPKKQKCQALWGLSSQLRKCINGIPISEYLK